MSLTLTLLSIEKGIGATIDAHVLIVPAGNYTAGAQVIDLTTLYNQTSAEGRTLDSSSLPIYADVQGMGAVAGTPNRYQIRTYTDPADGTPAVALTPATCRFQVFSGITEASTAAFTNTVLSDRIIAKLTFQSQQ